MARTVGIGHQDFEQVITNNLFYIDKTLFLKEWWENNDAVTLITRPRRFGKTLNMSMIEQFFFCQLCRSGRALSGFAYMERGKVSFYPGDFSGNFSKLCRGKGNVFFECTKKDMPDSYKSL